MNEKTVAVLKGQKVNGVFVENGNLYLVTPGAIYEMDAEGD